MAAFHAPDTVQVRLPQHRAIRDQLGATLLVPSEPTFLLQFSRKEIHQRLKVMSIITGIRFHSLGQRTSRPVGFLRAFLQRDTEKLRHQIAQAEFAHAQQAAGEHRVEDGRGNEAAVASEQPQVVVRAVQNQLMLAEDLEHRRELEAREGIDQMIRALDANLNETKLFRIGMKAVSLGIEGNPAGGAQSRKKGRQLLVRINHGANIGKTARRKRENPSNARYG